VLQDRGDAEQLVLVQADAGQLDAGGEVAGR
jgi:hypothetical protein